LICRRRKTLEESFRFYLDEWTSVDIIEIEGVPVLKIQQGGKSWELQVEGVEKWK
jgi:hypothetical protein